MRRPTMSPRSSVVTTLLALLLVVVGTAAEAAKLDRYLERQMRKARVPGLATAIVVEDEVVQVAGYGWASPGEGIPVTPDTLFLIASVSKPVTATVAMRLVERRLLRLDEDVNQYLPFEVRNPGFPDQPITLRQLLTHTSSISDERFYQRAGELVGIGDWAGTLNQFLNDYLTPGGRFYRAQSSFLAEAPGTTAAYSNVGFALVGALVQSVGGASFEKVSHREVLDPLGMSESSFLLGNLELGRVAVPCYWSEDRFEAYPHLGMAMYPAGQLRTSALQLANFARLHLNGGRFEGRRILKSKTAAEMVRVQMPEVDPVRGLAFLVVRDGDERFAMHEGGFNGATTGLWLALDAKIGVIVLTNGEAFAGGNKTLRAFYKIRNRLFKEAVRIGARDEN